MQTSNNTNNFIGLYEEGNIRIIGTLETYTSNLFNKEYDIITSLKILDTTKQETLYTITGLSTPFNHNYLDIIDGAKFIDMIPLYINSDIPDYIKTNFLNNVFTHSNFYKLESFHKRESKRLEESKQLEELNNTRKDIDSKLLEVQEHYNNKGMAAVHGLFDLFIIDDIKHKNLTIDFLKKLKFDNEELYNRHVIKHIKLEWNKSDIKILNSLLV